MSVAEMIQTISQQCKANREVNKTIADAVAQLIKEKLELEMKEVSR